MIGKLGISAAFADIYFLSAELFPTSIRSFILGLSCIFGRLGSLASPYIADLVRCICIGTVGWEDMDEFFYLHLIYNIRRNALMSYIDWN